jgi:flavin-dependent dehydrogenase
VQCDVVVAGAGPAGSLAAAVLARAGVAVIVVDRATFPRAKLCGDTLNPGAVRVLARYMALDQIAEASLPLDGMLLSGPGVSVRASYGHGVHGYAITRHALDQILLEQALDAGARLLERTTVEGAVWTASGEVGGVLLKEPSGRQRELRARYVIAADGRQSRLARTAGLTRQPRRPRRWAIGGYFRDAPCDVRYGEMHVRAGCYVGIAPVPGGLANTCLVLTHMRGERGWRNPENMLRRALATDPMLSARFACAELVERPRVLGPMAVDARSAGLPGLLLAGDAAGFIDPITGDGLRFAFEGASIAADVVSAVLNGRCGSRDAPRVLAARRRAAFGRKWRFNRAIRRLIAVPMAVSGAAAAARVAPDALRAVIRYAGDV